MLRLARTISIFPAFLLFLAAIAAPAPVGAQVDAAVDARTAAPTLERIEDRRYFFEAAGDSMVYALYVPSTYDQADDPVPLLVLLHGLGSTPGQIMRYQGITDEAEERGWIVVAPMGYNRGGWYGSQGPGLPRVGRLGGDGPENLGELSEQDVMNVLELTLEEFNVDSDRVYLMGHSMGGGGSWHLAITHPHRWAAIAPVAPAIYSSPDALEGIRHIPVIVLHGDEDDLVPVSLSRRWVARMEELDMTHRYIEIPGGDHATLITRSPENVRDLFDFLAEHRRPPS